MISKHRTPIFDKFHGQKVGTPVGGGLLVIVSVCALFLLLLPVLKMSGIFISSNFKLSQEIFVIFFTFISFAFLGLYDDILKFFNFEKTGFFGLRMKHKLILQIFLALFISLFIYLKMGINFIYLPFLGAVNLGIFFIPISTSLIVAFSNFNISDGLMVSSCGMLLISFAFGF